ncbi:MAG: DUF2726 domain-containing protein [Nitrospirae bacterium]|nr:MAG: DUF2726 domain-containing protein [Nitrospirota bacterium]
MASQGFTLLSLAVIVGLVGITAVTLYRHLRGQGGDLRPRASSRDPLSIPDTVTVRARALMDPAEAALLNLVQLAVRDDYLLFSHLPLRSLITITSEDKPALRSVLKAIWHVHVDFALIHPGTLTPAKAVFLDKKNTGQASQPQGEMRLLETLLHEAGIEVVRLPLATPYTVPLIRDLLGLSPEEEDN